VRWANTAALALETLFILADVERRIEKSVLMPGLTLASATGVGASGWSVQSGSRRTSRAAGGSGHTRIRASWGWAAQRRRRPSARHSPRPGLAATTRDHGNPLAAVVQLFARATMLPAQDSGPAAKNGAGRWRAR
jgi:hypothetical protein